jgi:hypothetical protein
MAEEAPLEIQMLRTSLTYAKRLVFKIALICRVLKFYFYED